MAAFEAFLRCLPYTGPSGYTGPGGREAESRLQSSPDKVLVSIFSKGCKHCISLRENNLIAKLNQYTNQKGWTYVHFDCNIMKFDKQDDIPTALARFSLTYPGFLFMDMKVWKQIMHGDVYVDGKEIHIYNHEYGQSMEKFSINMGNYHKNEYEFLVEWMEKITTPSGPVTLNEWTSIFEKLSDQNQTIISRAKILIDIGDRIFSNSEPGQMQKLNDFANYFHTILIRISKYQQLNSDVKEILRMTIECLERHFTFTTPFDENKITIDVVSLARACNHELEAEDTKAILIQLKDEAISTAPVELQPAFMMILQFCL